MTKDLGFHDWKDPRTIPALLAVFSAWAAYYLHVAAYNQPEVYPYWTWSGQYFIIWWVLVTVVIAMTIAREGPEVLEND